MADCPTTFQLIPSQKQLKEFASQFKIKGRSKMNTSNLSMAIEELMLKDENIKKNINESLIQDNEKTKQNIIWT